MNTKANASCEYREVNTTKRIEEIKSHIKYYKKNLHMWTNFDAMLEELEQLKNQTDDAQDLINEMESLSGDVKVAIIKNRVTGLITLLGQGTFNIKDIMDTLRRMSEEGLEVDDLILSMNNLPEEMVKKMER